MYSRQDLGRRSRGDLLLSLSLTYWTARRIGAGAKSSAPICFVASSTAAVCGIVPEVAVFDRELVHCAGSPPCGPAARFPDGEGPFRALEDRLKNFRLRKEGCDAELEGAGLVCTLAAAR